MLPSSGDDSDEGEMSPCRSSSAGNGVVWPVIQGDTGTGVGSVCSSPSAPTPKSAPGSKNEKKLCDNECLWWCPLRELTDEVEDEEDKEGAMGGAIGKLPLPPIPVDGSELPAESSVRRGRPPNVNPAPNGVVGCWCCCKDAARRPDLQLTLGPAEGTLLTGACSASCIPSSAIAEWGSDPGRGKKTERFRE